MAEQTTPTPASPTPTQTPVPTAKARLNRAEQDQKIANAITAAGEMIAIVRNDPSLSPLLAARGYDAAKLDEGAALQAAAQAAFNTRQTAMGAQKQATETQRQAEVRAD